MNLTFPLILDGAMGTQLQKYGIPQGACPEKWMLDNHEAVRKIQSEYVNAGAQIIYAPTFGANSAVLEKALRAYQGRVLYDGTLGDEVLLPLAEKYGLII